MAMNLAKLFSRADDEIIQDIIGHTSISLLQKVMPEKATPSQLKKLVVELFHYEGLLLKDDTRAHIIDLLRTDEIQSLHGSLGLRANGSLYESLKRLKFERGSEKEEILFTFFELKVPELDKKVVVLPVEEADSSYALFSHQRKAIRELEDRLNHGAERIILHMPTGSGKTRTTMNYICDFLRKKEPSVVIWLAYSEELCEQAVGEFKKAWKSIGNRKIKVQRFYSTSQWEDGMEDGIIVAGLAKMYSAIRKNEIQFINDLSDKVSLIIMDEAHQAVAESYNRILQILSRKQNVSIIGLTATPGRSYLNIEEDEKLASFFHRNKITLKVDGYKNPIDYLTDNGYLAKVTFEPLMHKGGNTITDADIAKIEKELDLSEEVLIKLGKDEIRNAAILSKLKSLVLRHKRIMFFSASVEHSNLIAFMLRAIGITAFSVTGQTPSSERAKVIRQYKSDEDTSFVLCNYGIFTTGFDAPKTSCAMIARPTKSLVLYSQMVGRAIRGIEAGGNEEADIITVVDIKLPGFRSMAEAFMNWEDVF